MDRVDQDENDFQKALDTLDVKFENDRFELFQSEIGRDKILSIFWDDFLEGSEASKAVWRGVQSRAKNTIERSETKEELARSRAMTNDDIAIIELFNHVDYVEMALEELKL